MTIGVSLGLDVIMVFGKRLRKLREDRGLTQRQLAEALGVSKSTIAMYESGKREAPHDVLRLLASFFDVTSDYLIGNESGSKVEDNPEDQLHNLGAHLRSAGATEDDVKTIMELLKTRKRLREAAEGKGDHNTEH